MAAVILALGLIAAGIYTGAWGFYVAAGVFGSIYLLLMLVVAAVAAEAKDAIKKGNLNVRRKF